MTEWQPTQKQQALLEVAETPGLARTVTKVCEEAGVSRGAFYEWMKDPGFKAAWEESWQLAIKRQMPGVVAAQVNQALDGDTAAARFLADLGGMTKQRFEHHVRAEIELSWADDDNADPPDPAAIAAPGPAGSLPLPGSLESP